MGGRASVAVSAMSFIISLPIGSDLIINGTRGPDPKAGATGLFRIFEDLNRSQHPKHLVIVQLVVENVSHRSGFDVLQAFNQQVLRVVGCQKFFPGVTILACRLSHLLSPMPHLGAVVMSSNRSIASGFFGRVIREFQRRYARPHFPRASSKNLKKVGTGRGDGLRESFA